MTLQREIMEAHNKLECLIDEAKMAGVPLPLTENEINLLVMGQKIAAIKALRARTMTGLLHAKESVEAFAETKIYLRKRAEYHEKLIADLKSVVENQSGTIKSYQTQVDETPREW